MTLNSIGLDLKKAEALAGELNVLLANFQIYYQNLRGIHWNIKGKRFFELHVKFEELYNDANIKVDLIAERILTLGFTPLHTFDDYSKKASIPVGQDISVDENAVGLIEESLTGLLKIERSILENSGTINDEGTNAMMSDFIAEQEKTIWMLKAWMNETV
ncbi:MAG: DNA starvation/stationary phase protection protein [Bacteroidia bacterium]|nr:DNA starvation/stationary phase protection protein [Bacteroidia bacterium]NND24669.1 DNA starvation/stationary phase protection protein [Flavobacteriaceae bacterium]NNK59011.1 DNA starvation/stationary phase protection protein [Flavobacteriaceae bacterium]NNL32569.1 DNA starvation/stationary phase protection protein [Flavobacteriaceae bacterium]RZW55521.1 MAG: DNA starvation/stationary phase protection protein [Flavobacteriaceae bacterium]